MAILAALPDGVQFAMWAFQVVFAAVVSVAIWRLTTSQRRQELAEQRLRDEAKAAEHRLRDETRAAEQRLHAVTEAAFKEKHGLVEKLVDERFRNLTHDMANSVQSFTATLAVLERRVMDSEKGLDGLTDQDHKIELAVVAKVGEIKDYIRDNAAGKKDLDKHEANVAQRDRQTDDRLNRIEKQVAVLADRMPAKGAGGGR